MELQDFIEKSLNQIIDGISEVEKNQNRKVCLKSPTNQCVTFDLMITVDESNQKEAGIRVMNIIGGGISADNKTSVSNRIQFSVYINSKDKTQEDKERAKLLAMRSRN